MGIVTLRHLCKFYSPLDLRIQSYGCLYLYLKSNVELNYSGLSIDSCILEWALGCPRALKVPWHQCNRCPARHVMCMVWRGCTDVILLRLGSHLLINAISIAGRFAPTAMRLMWLDLQPMSLHVISLSQANSDDAQE